MLLLLLNPSPPSTHSKSPPRSRLRVLFFVSCVVSIWSIHLSIYFTEPSAGSISCSTAALRLAVTFQSQVKCNWRRWCARWTWWVGVRLARPFGHHRPPRRHSTWGCWDACLYFLVHACSIAFCLLAEVDCSYFLAGMTSPPDDCRVVEMAHLDTLGYGGELVSAPECLRNGARTLFHFFNAALT